MTGEKAEAGVRKKIEVQGVVQGVGFRPFVYRIARRFDIRGWVLNSSDGVVIEAEGGEREVARLSSRAGDRTAAAGAHRSADDLG